MAFTFNVSEPTQCGDMRVKWDGGSPPYEIFIVPTTEVPNGKLINITVPSSAESAREYTFNLHEPGDLGILMSMSDSSGWGTGGSTPEMTVESSSNSSCLDDEAALAFTFYLTPSSPSQCSPLQINWPANATNPRIHGMIPGGSAWNIDTSSGPGPNAQQTSWQANVPEGTQMLLLMTADTGFGGSTNLATVGGGGGGCINGDSPSSASSGSGRQTLSLDAGNGGGSGGNGNDNGNDNGNEGGGGGGSSGTKTGAIVGGTLGGVAFIVLLGILLLCFCRRKYRDRDRRRSSTHSTLVGYGFGRKSGEKNGASNGNGSPGNGAVDLIEDARPSTNTRNSGLPMPATGAPFSVDGSGSGNGNGSGNGSADGHQPGAGFAGQREDGEHYRPSPFTYSAANSRSEAATLGHGPGAVPVSGAEAGIGGNGLPAGAAAGLGAAAMSAGAAAAGRTSRDEKRQSRGRFYMVSEPDPPSRQATQAQTQNSINHQYQHQQQNQNQYHPTSQGAPSESAVGTQGHANHGMYEAETKDSREVAHSQAQAEHERLEAERDEERRRARIVQHEDAGVIDLPPRYDQLRSNGPQ